MRSEAEVVADVVVELLRRDVIHKRQLTGVCRALGISVELVREAQDDRRTHGHDRYPAPSVFPPASIKLGAPTERAERMRRARSRRVPESLKGKLGKGRQRPQSFAPDGTRWLFCNRCPAYAEGPEPGDVSGVPDGWDAERPGRWHPEGCFIRKDRNANKRSTYCDDCRKRYQRERRVSTKALDALAQAGVRLVLDGDSNVVGIACKECGEAFVAGDTVLGEATLFHERCAPPDLTGP